MICNRFCTGVIMALGLGFNTSSVEEYSFWREFDDEYAFSYEKYFSERDLIIADFIGMIKDSRGIPYRINLLDEICDELPF